MMKHPTMIFKNHFKQVGISITLEESSTQLSVEITNLSYLPCGIYFIVIDNSQSLKFVNIK